ncbi:MAG: hypothetical protein IKV96_01085 [Firmicutes bacterium]|nr:hypothetical protein [Bacillota bacterium]
MDTFSTAVSGALMMPAVAGAVLVKKSIAGISLHGLAGRLKERISTDFVESRAVKSADKIADKIFGKARAKSRSQKADEEIFNGLGYIRNRIMSSEDSKITTDNMIEELLANAEILRPAYMRMLSLVRVDDRRRAAEEFIDMAFSEHAREYGRILIQLDEVTPGEVYETLKAFQKTIGESRITRLKKRDELVSDLLYLPVVLNLVIIFFNFIYTAYFIQQKDMLSMLM